MRFLKEVKEETTSRSKLKHLLVLFSRLLALAFLVFAFSQPYIPTDPGKKLSNNRVISIFVDNSFSMEANGREGTLFDEAKSKAMEVAGAFQPSDQFQLLTCDFDPAHQRTVSRDEFLDLLSQVKISPDVRKLDEVISRQRDAVANSGSKEKLTYVISDFQQSSTNLSNCKNDSSIQTLLVKVKSELRNNVFIDSCWLTSPLVQINTPCEINVKIKNVSPVAIENIPLKLTLNGIQKSLASISIDPAGQVVAKLSFSVNTPGWQNGLISITDFPITFDDQFYFTFKVINELNVISINGTSESKYLKAVFGGNSFFNLHNTNISQIDYNLFKTSNLIILNELKEISSGLSNEITKFIANGGSLVIFPDSNLERQSWSGFISDLKIDMFGAINSNEDRVARLDTKIDLFADVFEKVSDNMDLPVAQKHFEMASTLKTSREVLMKFQGGDALLSRYSFSKGKIYTFSVPLTPGFSGLSRHSIFVPVIYKIALLSSNPPALSYILGRNTEVNIGNTTTGGEDVFHLINRQAKIDVIPIHKNDPTGTLIDIPQEIKVSGNYDLTWKENLSAGIALNYDRNESDMTSFSQDDLIKQIEVNRLYNFKTISPDAPDLSKSIRDLNEGKKLWKLCIILALFFLSLEIVLLKFLK